MKKMSEVEFMQSARLFFQLIVKEQSKDDFIKDYEAWLKSIGISEEEK